MKMVEAAAIMEADEQTLEQIPDVGPVVATNITGFFRQAHNREVVAALLACGVNWPQHETGGKLVDKLAGQVFVITGTLSAMTRDEARDALLSRGAKVTGSISGKTDYLIVGANPGSKVNKAEELGIRILDENDFLQLLDAGR